MIDSRRPIDGKGRAAVVANVGAKVRPRLWKIVASTLPNRRALVYSLALCLKRRRGRDNSAAVVVIYTI